MKPVYFEILDFESKIPDNYYYEDLGYTNNLLEKTKEIYKNLGLPNDNAFLKKRGAVIEHIRGGRNILFDLENDGLLDCMFYTPFSNLAVEIHTRGHEEAHAIQHFGLEKELRKKLDLSCLTKLSCEFFCDRAGLVAVKKRRLKLPEGFFTGVPGKHYFPRD